MVETCTCTLVVVESRLEEEETCICTLGEEEEVTCSGMASWEESKLDEGGKAS